MKFYTMKFPLSKLHVFFNVAVTAHCVIYKNDFYILLDLPLLDLLDHFK